MGMDEKQQQELVEKIKDAERQHPRLTPITAMMKRVAAEKGDRFRLRFYTEEEMATEDRELE